MRRPSGHDLIGACRKSPITVLSAHPAGVSLPLQSRRKGTFIMTDEPINVIAGIDTHADTHHVAVITEYGRPVADQEFPATGPGYREILDFITTFGPVSGVGVEGTGSYGAELARVLARDGLKVLEVNRPNRQIRRLKGKSDSLDAYQAADAVIAERGISTPKARDGAVESLRVLRAERSSAMRAKVAVINQIKGLLIAAPEAIRFKYRDLSNQALTAALERSRPGGNPTDPNDATAMVLKRMAARHRHLEQELDLIEAELDAIVTTHAPLLRDLSGVGTDVASQLLVTVGDNPERVSSQAKFAALVGVAPIPASSGKTNRHRLSRGGDRAANRALHSVVTSRMASDPRTKAYVARRTEEGKSKKEIIRCLKRYVVREIYAQIFNPKPAPDARLLRANRKQKSISLQTVANALNTNMNAISRLERGLRRDDALYNRYESWLNDTAGQKLKSAA
jgi:transposase